MKQSQLLKGVLEGCVLNMIGDQPVYGYELMQRLHGYGFTSVVGGTLYPLLAKLEKQGDVTTMMAPSPDGPDRKYYQLSAQGKGNQQAFKEQWKQLQEQVAAVLGEGGTTHDEP